MKKDQIKLRRDILRQSQRQRCARTNRRRELPRWLDATNLATTRRSSSRALNVFAARTADQQVKDEAKSDPDLIPLSQAMKPAKAGEGAKTPRHRRPRRPTSQEGFLP